MTVASIRLRNGTEVSVNFGNNDGTISQAEIDDAIARLEARMGSADMPGAEYIDHDARVRITEGSSSVERSADVLVRNGAVRLFGNNPMRSNSTGSFDDNPALWHPTAVEVWPGGDRHTIYREVDRWDAAAGHVIPGRTVRITENGSRYILNANNEWRLGTTADHIPRLPFLGANEVDGLSGEDVASINARGTGLGRFVKVSVSAPAMPMSPAVPGGITMTEDWLFRTFPLTPARQELVGGRAYDVYTSTGASGAEFRYRRPHGGGDWEVQTGTTWAPATGVVSPDMAAVVGRTPPGWQIEYRSDGHTVFVELAGNHRSIRVSNETGAVEVRTGDTYRAATAADALPEFPHFAAANAPGGSPGAAPTSLTLQVAPGAAGRRTFALTPMSPPQMTEGEVVYDVFTATATGVTGPVYLRRPHGGTGGWSVAMNGGAYQAIPPEAIVNTPEPAPRPARPVGGGGGTPRRTTTGSRVPRGYIDN